MRRTGQQYASIGDQVEKMGQRFAENMATVMRLGDVAGLGNLSGVFERCAVRFGEQLAQNSDYVSALGDPSLGRRS